MKLRPYQQRADEQLDELLARGITRVMLCLPTGGGKTVCAASRILKALEAAERVLVVAHRVELLRQPFCRLLRAGIDPQLIGIIKGGMAQPPMREPELDTELDDWDLWTRHAYARPEAPIQIASIPTLTIRGRYPRAGLVIIDEAHRAVADSYLYLIKECCGAHGGRVLLEGGICPTCGGPPAKPLAPPYGESVVLGLSATPSGRTDGRGLDEVFEELIVVSTYRELAAQGYLMVPKVYGTGELPDLSKVKRTGTDYHKRQLAEVCDRRELIGNIVRHWLKRAKGMPTLVFATSVKHSQNIVERFREAGVAAAHVDGKTPPKQRDQIFADLTAGRLEVVSNVGVATEGTDLPCVGCIVHARPTMSVRIWLQTCGRGSRPHPTKKEFVILDHAGNSSLPELGGLPHWDREWTLAPRRKESRSKTALESLPPTYRCEGCQAKVPTALACCPECGEARPRGARRQIAERAGELRLLNDDFFAPDIERECWAMIVEEWQQKNGERLVPIKGDWCVEQFRARYGTNPRGVAVPKLEGEALWRFETMKRLRRKAAARGLRGAAFGVATTTWMKQAIAQRQATTAQAAPESGDLTPPGLDSGVASVAAAIRRPATDAGDVATGDASAGRGTALPPQQSQGDAPGAATPERRRPTLPGLERWAV